VGMIQVKWKRLWVVFKKNRGEERKIWGKRPIRRLELMGRRKEERGPKSGTPGGRGRFR